MLKFFTPSGRRLFARTDHTQKTGSLSRQALKGLLWQGVLLAAVAAVLWFMVANLLHNLSVRNIASGFGFLHSEAGFVIGESLISYQPSNSYLRAIVVGLLNTVRVALLSIVFASVLGLLLGLGRLSRNFLLRRLSDAYVEVFRNTPLLLQLFFWYALITDGLPAPRQAFNPVPGLFISNRGLKLPGVQAEALTGVFLGLGLALCVLLIAWHWGRRAPGLAAPKRPRWWWLLLVLVLPVAGGWLGGASLSLQLPQLKAFNFVGGVTVSPEFTALLLGLVLYTSAFIAEVVRAGVQSVPSGQVAAAQALGLSRFQQMRHVILPQALRLIVPPMTSQYLNVTKNSSLAVAIGYPDIVSVANTTLNRTGQAVEGILIIMAAYLVLSLFIAAIMNWYNRRLALPGY